MPCYDSRNEPSYILEEKLKSANEELTKSHQRVKYLEASLCALINETIRAVGEEKMNLIFDHAATNGEIDLKEFWQQHREEDIERLKSDLEGYSDHEKTLLLTLLQKK